MINFLFRVEQKKHGRWIPVYYPFGSNSPLESCDLAEITSKAQYLSAKYQADLRLVKVETHLIQTFNEY